MLRRWERWLLLGSRLMESEPQQVWVIHVPMISNFGQKIKAMWPQVNQRIPVLSPFFLKDQNVLRLSGFEDKVAIRWHRELAGEYVPLVHMFCDSDFVDINAVGEDQKTLSGRKCLVLLGKSRAQNRRNKKPQGPTIFQWMIYFPIPHLLEDVCLCCGPAQRGFKLKLTNYCPKSRTAANDEAEPLTGDRIGDYLQQLLRMGGRVGNWTPGAECLVGFGSANCGNVAEAAQEIRDHWTAVETISLNWLCLAQRKTGGRHVPNPWNELCVEIWGSQRWISTFRNYIVAISTNQL